MKKKNFYANNIDIELQTLTRYFTIWDWKVIYTSKYFRTLSALEQEWEKKNYILRCVDYYLKHFKNE